GAELPALLRIACDPLRWQLLTELAASDLRVRDLMAVTGQPQNLLSYHLRVLREGGFLSSTRSSHDARESYYHLDLDRFADQLAAVGAALHPALQRPTMPTARAERPAPKAPRVLFICTGNSARSPIAEALLQERSHGRVTTMSAGSRPKRELHPAAVRVLQDEYAIDVRGRRPQPWAAMLDRRFDYVISLCDKAREAWTECAGRPPRAHWSIPDPAASGDHAAFLRTAREIDTRIGHLLPSLALPPQ
ncbi:MAG: ArsR family transcriptional regulator, partial [Jatrophihabitantaceae bacterium]|nr:ArsR family transcriptional regulator [Jatrophihabitantaceae bacterium]